MHSSPRLHVLGHARFRVNGRVRLVRRAALAALAQGQPMTAPEWSIRLTDDEELHKLNHQYRHMDKPTDVLSFGGEGYHDGVPMSNIPSTGYLGDIVVSMERCAVQAAQGGHALTDELALLVIHGTLHLLGFDHDTRARKTIMWAAQSRALKALGIGLKVR